MNEEKEHKFLMWALQGNTEAVIMCEIFFRIAQTWDDLVDKDGPVSDARINEAFWLALIEMPQNRFYRAYNHELTPVMRQYINDWLTANRCELTQEDHWLEIAYVLRDSFNSIVEQCAYLIGGFSWMQQVSSQLKEFVFDENRETYKQSHLESV